jgi:hypothetical protein
MPKNLEWGLKYFSFHTFAVSIVIDCVEKIE